MGLIKKLLREILINMGGLWLSARLIPGISYQNQEIILPAAALALVILDRTAKPLLKIIFLPINLLTLGLFSWLTSALVVYLLTIIFTEITIESFIFPGLTYTGFVIPQLNIEKPVVIIMTATIIRSVNSFINWLRK